MTWPQKYDPLHNVALSIASSFTASRWRRWWAFWFSLQAYVVQFTKTVVKQFPGCLRQLPQRLLQISQPVDFRCRTLQRLHRGSDVREEMFVTLDQAEKSVST